MIEQAKATAERLRGDRQFGIAAEGADTIDALVVEVEKQKALHHDCAGQLRIAELEKATLRTERDQLLEQLAASQRMVVALNTKVRSLSGDLVLLGTDLDDIERAAFAARRHINIALKGEWK